MKLLKNSIDIKTSNLEKSIEKLKAIILIQIKVIKKYENFISILLSQIWGQEPRNKKCREYVFEYIGMIEDIIKDGIQKQELTEADSSIIASRNFWFYMFNYGI